MKRIIIPTAEPFYFPGDKTGCLLVHGFTGSPKEMRMMGEFLTNKGKTVLGIRLTGHATNISDMPRTRWQDWFACVEDGINILTGACEHIFIAGLSMGGLLALLAASIYPIDGAIAMSTPYSISSDWRIKLAKPLSIFSPFVKKEKSEPDDQKMEKRHVEYEAYPTRSIAELNELISTLKKNLSKINIPILLINSKQDKKVPIAHAEKYIHQILSSNIEHITLEMSGHVITEDIEREKVFNETLDFINKYSNT